MEDKGKKLARNKATQLTELLAKLEANEGTKASADKIGAKFVENSEFVDLPINEGAEARFLAVSCSGCGCACFSSGGAGHGCGTHAGHWA
jgi:hypothetical protein